VAVSPEEIAVAQIGQVAGQALEGRDDAGVGQIRILVGLSESQVLAGMLQRRDARMARLEARIAALETAVSQTGEGAE
jgi:hypothetical protein